MERVASDPLDHAHGNQRGFARSALQIEWPRAEESKMTATAMEPKRWFCLFRTDAGPMAVSVESVTEVLETDTLVPLAWSPPQVVGLCSYHRDVIPVVVLGPLARGAHDNVSGERDQAPARDPAGEKAGTHDQSRSLVLILKTEHGAWGIRVDSESTTISRESPEYHSPRMLASGAALIGIVQLAGTCYEIIDAEATWRGLRSVVSRWTGLKSESNPSSPLPSESEPIPAGPGTAGEHRRSCAY
jgi:chemotaxis signal transduction protein